MQGELDEEARSAACARLRPHLATVAFRDLARDAQPASGSEPGHQFRQLRGRDALALVLDRDAHEAGTGAPPLQLHRSAARREADGICDQVVENAAEQLSVGVDLHGAGGGDHRQRHAVLFRHRQCLCGCGFEQAAQIHRSHVEHVAAALLRCLQDALGELHGTQALPRAGRGALTLGRSQRGVACKQLRVADHRL